MNQKSLIDRFLLVSILVLSICNVSLSINESNSCIGHLESSPQFLAFSESLKTKKKLSEEYLLSDVVHEMHDLLQTSTSSSSVCNERLSSSLSSESTEAALTSMISFLLLTAHPATCKVCTEIATKIHQITDQIAFNWSVSSKDGSTLKWLPEPEDLCQHLMPFCAAGKTNQLLDSKQLKTDITDVYSCVECSACKAGLLSLQYKYWLNDQVQQGVMVKWDKWCDTHFYTEPAKTCKIEANKMIKKVFTMLHQQLKPDPFCKQTTSLCRGSHSNDNFIICLKTLCEAFFEYIGWLKPLEKWICGALLPPFPKTTTPNPEF